MRAILLLAVTASIFLIPVAETGAQPQEWELLQNDPNPFCGFTTIAFAAPEVAEVHLVVWNPDESDVVRVLVQGLLNAGYYQIQWDQLDDDGIAVPSDDYPYQLIALNPETRGVLFEAWLIATVECEPTPTLEESWGRIKRSYDSTR